jgi:predicted GIY-YIG superfamily endonuclease
MDLYLYIIECKQNDGIVYKIGVTNDLQQRIKNVRTGNPNPVEYVYNEQNNNAYKLEKWLHSQLSEHRLEGEWFKNITVKDIRMKIFQYNEYEI